MKRDPQTTNLSRWWMTTWTATALRIILGCVVAITIVLLLNGCGIFMCNDENEMMFPCPVGPCLGRCK